MAEPMYRLGFLELANMLGRDLVGQPLEDEQHNPENGDGTQRTIMPSGAQGLMAWRKADNWTAFSNGYETWIRGPESRIYRRLNDGPLFDWEAGSYRPHVYQDPAPAPAVRGLIGATPKGIILHGSRSTRRQSLFLEFHGTRAYARAGCPATDPRTGERYFQNLAWHLTVGEDEISEHLPPDRWGYHAREWWSQYFVGIEFAQPTEDYDVTDTQVRAAAWWIRERLLVRWPEMPLHLLAHSEIDPGIRDGKTDVYPRGDRRNDELRERILALL